MSYPQPANFFGKGKCPPQKLPVNCSRKVRAPMTGDSWTSQTTGHRFIYQNCKWHQMPSKSKSCPSPLPPPAASSIIPFKLPGDESTDAGQVLEGFGYYRTVSDREVKIKVIGNIEISQSKTKVVIPFNDLDPPLPEISCDPLAPNHPVVNITLETAPGNTGTGPYELAKDAVFHSIIWNPLFPSLSLSIVQDYLDPIDPPIPVTLHVEISYLKDSEPLIVPKTIVKNISAEKTFWDFGSTGAYAFTYAEDGNPGTIPGPTIWANQGDTVILNFTNNLPIGTDPDLDQSQSYTIKTPSSIHPHGIELNNFSDGTPVTQNAVPYNGGTFTYQFKVPRPGVFWYHPHFAPLDQVFHGLYGAIIVEDCADKILQTNGIIPTKSELLVFSSVSFTGAGKIQAMEQTIRDAAFGNVILVNGTQVPLNIPVQSGEGIRLRLLNPDIFRFYNVSFQDGSGATATIYRIGGEGGLLDHVRIEGGMLGSFDTQYPSGTILLPAAARADVVVIPTGNYGETATLKVTGFNIGQGASADEEPIPPQTVVNFHLQNPASQPFNISQGDALRAHPLVDDPVENIKEGCPDQLVDPTTIGKTGSSNPIITLTSNNNSLPSVDTIKGIFDIGNGSYLDIPNIESTRYGYLCDLLELSVQNTTMAHHPFHLHGFSMQPIKIESITPTGPMGGTGAIVDSLLYTWDYNEFMDVIDIPPEHRITFRIRLDDRPKPNGALGGGIGRWVFHCHIFRHAAEGMISELEVLPRP